MFRAGLVLVTCLVGVGLGQAPAASGSLDCKNRMDIFTVIDASDSIGLKDFVTLKTAIQTLIANLTLGSDQVRMGLLVFSRGVYNVTNFSWDRTLLDHTAGNLYHAREGTNTDIAIARMRKMFEQHGRPDVPKVCLVITDGISKNEALTIAEAKAAKREKISMFAIGITDKIIERELLAIASSPQQVKRMKYFSQLSGTLIKMMDQICPCPAPEQYTIASVPEQGPQAIGTVLTYRCETGYFLLGNPRVECLENSTWSVADFECFACPLPMQYDDVKKVPQLEYKTGTSLTYECQNGLYLVGNPTITCRSNATWSEKQFYCKACPIPMQYTNAELVPEHEYKTGSVLTYTCKPEYSLVGIPSITCRGNATWSPTRFTCEACPVPMQYDIAEVSVISRKIGAQLTYKCAKGHFLVGNPNITCLGDATWSPIDFECHACPIPMQYANALKVTERQYMTGSVLTYQCQTGYYLDGNPNMICREDATWSLKSFECRACPVPTHYEHTEQVLELLWKTGSVLIHKCLKGYHLEGDARMTCRANATWSPAKFRCKACPFPMQYTNAMKVHERHYLTGDNLIYQCQTGYKLVGNPKMTCRGDATWSPKMFTCKGCPNPDQYDIAEVIITSRTIGSELRYRCLDGYHLVGNPIITCLGNITWSAKQFECHACPIPMQYTNAMKVPEHQYKTRSVLTYQCQKGYVLEGNPSVTCLDDATWSPVQFRCKGCPSPMQYFNAKQVPEHEYPTGSVLIYECEPGYYLNGSSTTTCRPDATWSTTVFDCRSCPVPLQYENAEIVLEILWKTGSVLTHKCLKGYTLVGNPNMTCLADATWTTKHFECKACPEPVHYDIADVVVTSKQLGTILTYTCNKGFYLEGNPDIKCLPNATWSPVDFACYDCGEPPLLKHGNWTTAMVTIGAEATAVCNTGYAGIGINKLVCRHNATWSESHYSCSSCGAPPNVTHGFFEGSGFLVGDTRRYGCQSGYLAAGYPMIQCQSDATWSILNFTCEDCGPPPYVPNAYTSLGDITINSTVKYVCEDNYDMVGGLGRTKRYALVTCLPNGYWENPGFSCNVKTTTTTTTPAPDPVDPDVCDKCTFLNGVGYYPHPYDCNKYLQCYRGPLGGFMSAYRHCPFGLFWDQYTLTCDEPSIVQCEMDPCTLFPFLGGYEYDDSARCCSYWTCHNNVSMGDCCGAGMKFDPFIETCVDDFTCDDTCLYEEEMWGCDLRPSFESDFKYEQYIGSGYWMPMPCAHGTKFDVKDCTCVHAYVEILELGCQPALYAPFDSHIYDMGPNQLAIGNENVIIQNGMAYFDGTARLTIYRFTNYEFGGNFILKFKYHEDVNASTAHLLQALVTNGDCGLEPTIMIAKMPGAVLMGAKTSQVNTVVAPTEDTYWKSVIYHHNEERLEAEVCGASESQWSWGPIQSTHCALQIGQGTGLHNFVGYIKDLTIYQCLPPEEELYYWDWD